VSLVVKVLTDVVNSFAFVKEKENTKVFLSNFLDSSLEFKSMFFFDPNCGLLVEQVNGFLYEKANEEFDKHGIVVPYEILTLEFENSRQKNLIKEQFNLQNSNTSSDTSTKPI
jgi:small-conductance mechanosensitive channel